MTWVIGISTVFGYGVVLSDTCVTITNPNTGERKTIDAVQKAYPLAPFLVGGFAGSIDIGFQLLHDMREFLFIPPREEKCAWHIDWVAENWQHRAKEVFARSRLEEQTSGAHFLLLGAHPIEDVGIPGFARIQMAIFKSPDFYPVISEKKFLAIESIGSGAGAYMKKIGDICAKESDIAMAESLGFGVMGSVLTHDIMDHLRSNPITGVSQHLHSIIVKRGGFASSENNFLRFHPDGRKEEFKMPVLAKNYQELLKLLELKHGEAVLTA